MIAILHTWGQQPSLHPHLHCIVPGGGLSRQDHWKNAKSKGKYLFPAKAMGLMALDALGFIRRFSMHILPKGLVRIRHYGILGSTYKKET